VKEERAIARHGVNTTGGPLRGRRRIGRTGSVYIFLLLVAMLVTVIGLSAVAVERVKGRESAASNDWGEAGVLAQAGIEHALVVMNGNSAWRTLLANNTPGTAVTMGRGTYQWKFVDEADGDLINNASQPVRLYGIGRVGQATRLVSVLVPGVASLDALRAAAYSGMSISVSQSATINGGPAACAGVFTVNQLGVLNGNVEAGSVSNNGAIVGAVTAPASPRTMPASGIYDTYLALATDIPYTSLSSGQILRKLLSAASNPYGTANAQGIYKIDVPANKTLTLYNSRVVATLLVNLGSGARLQLNVPNLWQAPAGNYPILIVRSNGAGIVMLQGSTNNLMEAACGVNFNPAGTPYNGVSNTNMTDVYPCKVSGFIHITGTQISTTVSNLNLERAIITEGPLALTNGSSITVDPSLYTNPPMGYSSAATTGQYLPTAGSWRWEMQP